MMSPETHSSPAHPAHVLILGCGRSGTSIFGELFDHIPTYTYYSEPPFDRLLSLDYSKPVAVKVPRESPDFPSDPGLSFPLLSLQQTVPRPLRIFWQVRHPLDTICSLKVGISRDWGHHPQPPDWREWLARPLVERCAHHWNYINTYGYKTVGGTATITRFEDMILQTSRFAKRISKLIGLDSDIYQSNLRAWSNRVQNSNNDQFREAETSKSYSTQDHRVKVGRWKENLSPEEVEQVTLIVKDTAERFGYQI